jgi:hypothetical protein
MRPASPASLHRPEVQEHSDCLVAYRQALGAQGLLHAFMRREIPIASGTGRVEHPADQRRREWSKT